MSNVFCPSCGSGLFVEQLMDKIENKHDPLTVVTSPLMDKIENNHNALNVVTTIPVPSFSISARLAAKDSWADTIAGCVGVDNNHDATDLQIASAAKDTYISFDLSAYPAGATVTVANLILNIKTAPAVSANISLFKITDANETWAEGTIKCSNRPGADGAAMQTFAGGTVTGEKTIALVQACLDRLDARMGQGSVTFLIQTASLTGYIFQSKDSGGSPGNNSGPRLEITFTQP